MTVAPDGLDASASACRPDGLDQASGSAYALLRTEILLGVHIPGARLKIGDLCRDSGFNASAIRESLSRLSSEGLVVWNRQRGFYAAPVSRKDLWDLTAARVLLEGVCLRRAIEIGSVAWEAGVASAAHMLARTPKVSPADDRDASARWSAAHDAFHHSLCAACDNGWLLKIRDLLHVQSERYRMLTMNSGVAAGDHGDEHPEFLEAIIARDADRAVALIEVHFWKTTHALLDVLAERGFDEADGDIDQRLAPSKASTDAPRALA